MRGNFSKVSLQKKVLVEKGRIREKRGKIFMKGNTKKLQHGRFDENPGISKTGKKKRSAPEEGPQALVTKEDDSMLAAGSNRRIANARGGGISQFTRERRENALRGNRKNRGHQGQ